MRVPSALVGLVFLASCAPDTTLLPQDFAPDQAARGRDATAVYLLHLDTERLPALPSSDASPSSRATQLEQHARALSKQVADLAAALPVDVEWVRHYAHLPVVVVRAEAAGSDRLEQLPGVVRLELEPVESLVDTQSLGLIGQPAAAASGFDGGGTSVVVLDTGANYTHPDLGSCTSVGVPSTCRVAYVEDIAADDGSLDADGHGTNVSAIVASVAPAADIISLDVFTGHSGFGSDVLAGLDWVVSNQATYAVAAVNMSLGSGRHTSDCVNAYTSAIDVVRSAGVSVVIASGNDGFTNAVASPACNAAALTVGAVYDAPRGPIGYASCSDTSPLADQVTCFSNASSGLDLVAPGALITAGGHTMAGTSQAAPHVAGAMAVLRAVAPDAALDDLELQLLETGHPVLDTRNGLTFPRLDLAAATSAGPAPDPDPDPDPEPPSASSVLIEDDAATTGSNRVTLTLSALDATSVCLSNTDRCTRWVAYAQEKAWRLPTQTGEHTVYALFRDSLGGVTGPYTDTIVLDRQAPTTGTLVAEPGDAQLHLSWGGFADVDSGVDHYRVMVGLNSPPSCATGTPAWEGSETAVSVGGLTNGTRYGVSVCAVDAVGNVSRPVTARVVPIPESDGPVGSLVINDGAPYTRTRRVGLALAATDASSVTSACVTNDIACRSFTTMRATRTWNLPSRDGLHTVTAQYRDEWQTVGAPVTSSILLDSTGPAGGTAVATSVSGGVDLTWSDFSDSGSGVASYIVSQSASTTPPSNCRRNRVYLGTDPFVSVSNLASDRDTAWRICPVDVAGNVGPGVTVTGSPGSESEPPVGSLVLDDGSGWTASRAVTANLTATDASGVESMCLSTTETCTRWVTYRTTSRVSLSTTPAEQTVRVWFRDVWGNVSAPVTATTQLDVVRPTDGTANATGSSGVVTLDWQGFVDVGSGIVTYEVGEESGTRSPRCTRPLWTGTDTTLVLPDREDGTTYSYVICAVDAAGNRSSGVEVTGRPAPEYVAPVGTVEVNGGDAFSASRDVSVVLTASDDSGVAQMCVTTDTTCTDWQPFTSQTTLRLASRRTVQTVSAFFRDVWGNVSTAATTTVQVDSAAPSDGRIDGVYIAPDAIDLTWSGFSDAGIGIASYVIVGEPGTRAPTCDATPLFESTGEAAQIPVPISDSFAFRVCAVDHLGNRSTGARRVVHNR